MQYSKLLLLELRKNNGLTKVTSAVYNNLLGDTLSPSRLHQEGIEINEPTHTFLTEECHGLPQMTQLHLFSVAGELARIPRAHSALTFRDIQRAIYVRGRAVTPGETLFTVLSNSELFGDRFVIFPLQHSACVEGEKFSFLSWRNHGTREGGCLKLLPRTYLFTDGTWIAFRKRK